MLMYEGVYITYFYRLSLKAPFVKHVLIL